MEEQVQAMRLAASSALLIRPARPYKHGDAAVLCEVQPAPTANASGVQMIAPGCDR